MVSAGVIDVLDPAVIHAINGSGISLFSGMVVSTVPGTTAGFQSGVVPGTKVLKFLLLLL
jgi:hypothetical protein